ncbi:MAG TPA: LamG domain-containing protein [Humisphaera sp.]|jgi:hypothetical protein|nr:LamG domain-containing protein [Humisphaera sp.]
MAYSSTILADAPVGYWRLGESSGTVAADASGNGRDGVYHNGPALGSAGAIAGDSDTAASFDGADDYVAIPYQFNSANASWEAWVYLTSTPANPVQIVGCEDGFGSNVADKLLYVDAAGKPNWYIYSSGAHTITGASALTLNAWHHLVGTADGSTITLYVDGASVASASAGGSYAFYGSSNVWISGVAGAGGANPTLTYFPGVIDEAALYNFALSAAQVAAHYAAGAAAPGPKAPPISARPRLLQGASVVGSSVPIAS